VDEALARLRDGLALVTAAEMVPIADAFGRVLARDVAARRSSPPGANAAVDGWGFAHAALPADGVLPIEPGRAAAGAPFGRPLPAGRAVRILTGALLPEGVDTVVLQEEARAADGRVALPGAPKPGANTRRAGEDVEAGAVALPAGRTLGAPELALLASVGVAEVALRERLRVGVLSTGDEIAEPGETADPARTYDANRPMLLAVLRRWGHDTRDLGRVPDDRDALRGRLDGAGAHAILVSGGASGGEEDHVSALLSAEGRIETWRIAIKPGRPLALGLWRGTPVFGLPGNPVAALVCALLFARPALSVMAGGGWPEPQGFEVPAAFSKRKKAGRREFLRARMRGGRAEVFGSEGSGRISGLSWAEGLVELGDGAREVAPGDPVRFLPYGAFGL
jgi:molybdopterin molybdotransferase